MIPKTNMIKGAYYRGHCRNASLARWNGKVFVHWRHKFSHRYLEEIEHEEDDTGFDRFIPDELVPEPMYPEDRIPC